MGQVATAPNTRIRTRLAILDDSGVAATPIVSGGTVTISGGYVYHTFTADGYLNVWTDGDIEYLIVGGGGGGGRGPGSGGGGAGEYEAVSETIAAGLYPIVVGAGGAGGVSGSNAITGGNSTFNGRTALGGGRGGSQLETKAGGNGGSGGGGGYGSADAGGSSTAAGGGTGSAGGSAGVGVGTSGGGGGGASAAGANGNGPSLIGGAGGAGTTWSNGTTYAGGGGGGSRGDAGGSPSAGAGGAGGGGAGSVSGAGTNGTANTGGGGGGAGYNGSYNNGGNGGSGIVIVRYPVDALLDGQYASGGTIAVNGNNIEHTFAAGGNFALTISGLIVVSWAISATGTFDGSGASGGPANKSTTCVVTVTSGTVVVSYQPGDFQPGHPAALATAQFCYDFSILDSITDAGGGAISALADLAGSLNLSQGTGGLRPTTGAESLVGWNVGQFAGDYLDAASAADWEFLHDGTDYCVVAVVKFGTGAAPGVGYGLIGTNAVASANIGTAIYYEDTGAPNDRIEHFVTRGVGGTWAVYNSSANGACTANAWHLTTVLADPNNGTAASRSSMYVDGGSAIANNAATAAVSGSNATYPLQLGAGGNGIYPLTGAIAAIACTNDPNDRTAIEAFFTLKYGL